MKTIARRYMQTNGDQIPVKEVVRKISEIKEERYSVYGQRPYQVSTLYMGWNKDSGYQLFKTGPDESYSSHKFTSIGRSHQLVMSYLNVVYHDDETNVDEKMCKPNSAFELYCS